MTKQTRLQFSAEFRLESAQPLVGQAYTVREATRVMSAAKSTIEKWIRQLGNERKNIIGKITSLTPDLSKVRAIEKKIKRMELEQEILKKLPLSCCPNR